MIQKGDYVLATKWSDGDPKDQWCVGFHDGEERGRHFVTDNEGNQFRCNGFRRVAKISQERGEFILRNRPTIEWAERSLWWWKRCSMKKVSRDISILADTQADVTDRPDCAVAG